MINSNIKLIILDFDGTLADTREAHTKAYLQTLGEAGIAISKEEYEARYFGMRCHEFLEELGIADFDTRERLRLRKIDLYPGFFDSLKINRPLWDFCRAFQQRGVKVWIVSTGSRANIENAMNYLGIGSSKSAPQREGYVDGILCGADIEHSKPAPDCFLEAMRREGCTPRETIIFEDSKIGLTAAAASGASFFKVEI